MPREPWSLLVLAALATTATAAELPPTFPASAEIVELDVAVSDGRGRSVPDLRPADLAVFEDGVAQQVSFFSGEALPVSLVLLVDTSGSMAPHFGLVRKAVSGFLEALRPGDRAQLRRFDQSAAIQLDLTSDRAALRRALDALQPFGSTALYTALYVTLSELRAQPCERLRRQVVVLLTDGHDTASIVSEEQVLRLAQSSDVAVYSIGPTPRQQDPEDLRARHFMTELARDTGGQAFFPAALSELPSVYASIAQDLRTRYLVGYVPVRAPDHGALRRISILTPGRAGLRLRHRLGYYQPAASAAGP
jgi:Ca-activated chloride channel homolog